MKEAMYYKKAGNNEVYCMLCPHLCKLRPDGTGICRSRKNIDGSLYSMNYGKITSYGFDPVEKKPLYHFYPGRKIFSIGSFGCNLDCDFCQNWEITRENSMHLDISNKDLITLAQAQESIGIAYTYNEPTIFYEFVYDMARLAKEKGMKNVLVTNGYINQEPLLEILPFIDGMNIDLKSIDDNFYKTLCKGRLKPVLETIKTASKYTHVEITSLLIDGKNSSLEEVEKIAETISQIDKQIPLHLSRYFPNHRMKLPPTKLETLLKGREMAKKYLDYVYIGNIWGVDNNTICPECKILLVDRNNNGEIYNLEDGNCTKCGKKINILY